MGIGFDDTMGNMRMVRGALVGEVCEGAAC